MTRYIRCFFFIPAVLIGSTLWAQDPAVPQVPEADQQQPVVDDAAPTESMWFYLHEQRRYDDPKIAIRRVAEQKAAQRRLRLASQKWFGFSPSRPTASPIPYMGTYAPRWVGTGRDPFAWVGGGYATTVVRVAAHTETTIQR